MIVALFTYANDADATAVARPLAAGLFTLAALLHLSKRTRRPGRRSQ